MRRAAALILLSLMLGCDHPSSSSSEASAERPVPAAAAPEAGHPLRDVPKRLPSRPERSGRGLRSPLAIVPPQAAARASQHRARPAIARATPPGRNTGALACLRNNDRGSPATDPRPPRSHACRSARSRVREKRGLRRSRFRAAVNRSAARRGCRCAVDSRRWRRTVQSNGCSIFEPRFDSVLWIVPLSMEPFPILPDELQRQSSGGPSKRRSFFHQVARSGLPSLQMMSSGARPRT